MTFISILELSVLLYFAELMLYAYAAYRSRRTGRQPSVAGHQPPRSPKVSVVVAAKDEEKNLPACLNSLVGLQYPRDKLEIIIVNDQSTDATPSLIDKMSRDFGYVRRVDAKGSSALRGKPNALSQGIENATGEFIFLTDADCVVPPTWITETLKYFDGDTGIVGGVTLISKTSKPIYGIQALDWDFLLTVGAGAATIGKPIACLGNNLVVRKKAYDEIGGYKNIKFSVTEDFALLKAIARSGKWSYCYPMEKSTLVETLPVESFREVFSQRKRWATGGKETGFFGYITLAPGFILHWLIILSLFRSLPVFVSFFFLKSVIDSLFVYPTLKHYGKIAHLKFILYFEIYYLIYVAVLPFAVYFGKGVIWKGRKY
ncbi:MAG TPA: glycosyltransferase [Candidatus Acidoferrales bacterium]|nr:glycosyltransferase [Candidatus Acidoferrales bacterium]